MIPNPRPDAPVVAAIGLVGWDRVVAVERYPPLGGYSLVTDALEALGGTTANSATAARRLGANVYLAAKVGDDSHGRAVVEHLAAVGIDTSAVAIDPTRPTDGSTVIVDRTTGERAILWHEGAQIARGDRLDIDRLFGADILILDVADLPLRRFLSDLPAHTRPRARLLGPLTYLADVGAVDAVEIALRHDVVVGNEREFVQLSGVADPDAALESLRARLRGSNARLLVMTRGVAGATAASLTEVVSAPGYPVDCLDATGAGDAFVGALAIALAQRRPIPEALRLANAVGAQTTTALGAQAGQPSLVDALALADLDGVGPGHG